MINVAEGRSRRRTPEIALAALALASLLSGVGVMPLQEPDEARYAEIAREMATSGDVVTPRLDGIRYFEKPPLFFWCSAASMQALGVGELSARVPSVVAAVACLVLVASMARAAFGARTAALAVLLLATTPLYVMLARAVIVDMVLCALHSLCLLAALRLAGDGAGRHRGDALVFWLSASLSVLCKGPVGLALPLVAVALFALASRSLALPLALASPVALAAATALAAPWFLLMERSNPGYLRIFLLEQNLQRMAGGNRFGRDAPLWYYLPILIVAFLPWTGILPLCVPRVARSARACATGGARAPSDRARLLLACSVVAPLVLLSAAHSKLPHYLVPLLPPLAILTADALAREEGEPRPVPGLALALGGAATAVAAVLAVLVGWKLDPALLPRVLQRAAAQGGARAAASATQLGTPLLAASTLLLLAIAASAALARRRRPEQALVPLALVLCLAVAAGPWLMARAGSSYSSRAIAEALAPHLDPGDEILCFREFYRGIPFYLGRPVVLWSAFFTEFGQKAGATELEGRSFEQDKEALRARWHEPRRLVAVVGDAADLEKLRAIVGAERVHVLQRLGDVAFVANMPAAPAYSTMRTSRRGNGIAMRASRSAASIL